MLRPMNPEELRGIIHSDPEIMGGTPVFVGTRVPLQNLIDYLESGESVEDFLEGFPTVKMSKSSPSSRPASSPSNQSKLVVEFNEPSQMAAECSHGRKPVDQSARINQAREAGGRESILNRIGLTFDSGMAIVCRPFGARYSFLVAYHGLTPVATFCRPLRGLVDPFRPSGLMAEIENAQTLLPTQKILPNITHGVIQRVARIAGHEAEFAAGFRVIEVPEVFGHLD